jgi:UDP-glucuronate 4-epimerase
MLCLRFFTVYGPRQRPDLAIRKFATLMTRGKPIPLFGAGTTERDYTWIDDIVAGVLAAIDRGTAHPQEFEIVNLGGNRVTSLSRLVELLSDAFGITPTIERLPPQPGDVERTWADVSKAQRLLGYRPSTPIEEGIARFATWFNSEVPSD